MSVGQRSKGQAFKGVTQEKVSIRIGTKSIQNRSPLKSVLTTDFAMEDIIKKTVKETIAALAELDESTLKHVFSNLNVDDDVSVEEIKRNEGMTDIVQLLPYGVIPKSPGFLANELAANFNPLYIKSYELLNSMTHNVGVSKSPTQKLTDDVAALSLLAQSIPKGLNFKSTRLFAIQMQFDSEESIWVAECDELSLVTEAETQEELIKRVKILAPEMIKENNIQLINKKYKLSFEYSEEFEI